MRLHRLEISAFGPFAGTEVVDMDALSSAGLFLLSGPTGAGKSSVLDAVCFALYGRLPGARAGSTRLRSDHAAAGAVPTVVCEFSAAGRRFEVTRSPAWERPKRRGEGTTRQPACTLLRELVAGQWQAVTGRGDEAAQLLTDLLGMGAEQFTQVVMLPQGEFATFLRAGADERRPVLQRLFNTDRFAAVETWLAEERRRLSRQLSDADQEVGKLLARVHQAAAPVPELAEALAEPQAPLPDDPTHPQRVADLAGVSRARAQQAASAQSLAAQELELAQARLADAQRTSDRRVQWQRAVQELREARHHEDTHRAARSRLQRASRAAPVAVRLEYLDQCATTLAAAGEQLTAASEEARCSGVEAALLDRPLDDPVRCAVRSWREEVARLDDLVEDARALAEWQRRCAQASESRSRATADLAREEVSASEIESARALVLDRLEAARSVAAQRVGRADQLRRAQVVAGAVAERDRTVAQVRTCEQELDNRREAAMAARERWLDLRQQRLDGMAAELAAGLVAGCPCPVCGSADHPEPAPVTGAGDGAQAEDAARAAHEGAEERRTAALTALGLVQQAHAGAEAVAGGLEPSHAADLLASHQRELAAADQAVAQVPVLVAELERLEQRLAASGRARQQASAEAAQAGERVTAAREQQLRVARNLELARGGDVSIDARRHRIGRMANAAEELQRRHAELRRCQDANHEAHTEARSAAAAAGFADLQEVRTSVLDNQRCQLLQRQVEEHESQLASLSARLHDADLAAAGQRPEPDLAAAQNRTAVARQAHEQATRRAGREAEARDALNQLSTAVAGAVAQSHPVRLRYELVCDVSRCAEGSGGGNAMRMRLSSYVLAARLEQVAAAASMRLVEMSGGRFTLVHCDDVERGGLRSGLGLRVVDAWTGQERETTTLSGGESFMASLALALGLADVVVAEAGGTSVDTLFVDEGFGSLDEETLDEVMDVLDDLRAGGRTVGLVSHVAELRVRVPAQLQVVKTRRGSHLRQLAGQP